MILLLKFKVILKENTFQNRFKLFFNMIYNENKIKIDRKKINENNYKHYVQATQKRDAAESQYKNALKESTSMVTEQSKKCENLQDQIEQIHKEIKVYI